ncbi:MAG: hypothetical protein IJS45_00505 [Clostridia bacterium]|nr:hypothetical protein [Clostridia bacterium]
MLQFNFESSDNLELLGGTHGLMPFSGAGTTKDAAIAEGKLLSAFGDPVLSSEDAENSFNYIIIASTDDGRNCVLTVYGIGGTIHIGAKDQADFVYKAADALCEYVNAFEPTDYKRTTYYLDFGVQIDISVRGGIASVTESEIPELKLDELFKKFYG